MNIQRIFKYLPVTCSLITINIVVYILQQVIPHYWVFQQGAFNALYIEYTGEWWRAFTSGFIHDQHNIGHLGMNMLTLYLFGQTIEPLMRRWQFLVLYCLSILGGSAMIWLVGAMSGNLDVTTVGASGGVFGLFGAYFAIAKLSQQSTVPILVLVAVNFGYGFLAGNVSWEAHLGGLITGAVVAFSFARIGRARAVRNRRNIAVSPADIAQHKIPSAYEQYQQSQRPSNDEK